MFFFVFNDLRGFRFVHIGGIVIVAVLSWRHNNVVLSVSQMSNMTDTINQSYVKTFLSMSRRVLRDLPNIYGRLGYKLPQAYTKVKYQTLVRHEFA
jgi:hypothetical protein